MKPHEQTLTVMQFDKERRCIVEGGQRMVAVLRNYDSAEWERLLTAAPEMARELLSDLIQGGPDDAHRHTKQCWENRTVRAPTRLDGPCSPDCARKRTILAKAGVPLT